MLHTCAGLCSDVSLDMSSAESIAGMRAAHSEWPGMSCLLPAAVAYIILGACVAAATDVLSWHTVFVCKPLAWHSLAGHNLCRNEYMCLSAARLLIVAAKASTLTAIKGWQW